jgi:diguanylate cyclase (GGDEF)-like protein
MWTLWASVTLAAYLIAVMMHDLFAAPEVVWLLFSSLGGGSACLVVYAWSRISELNRDHTTGLYRRSIAEAHLTRIADIKGDVTIAMIDLNGLRDVNNHLGHANGDLFIQQAARRLNNLPRLGKRKIVSRFGGGDEFVVIIEGRIDIHDLADAIEEALHAKHPYTQNWGLGVAGVAHSRTGKTRVALECADAAMYRAKLYFRNTSISRVLVYDSHYDGEPKYTKIVNPNRAAARRRDNHKGD